MEINEIQAPPVRAVAVRRPGAAAQIFGHFTKREFWVELVEGIVKASVTAFFIALGDTLIKYGKRKGGAETPDIYEHKAQPSPAAQAFSRGYQPQTSYNPLHSPSVSSPSTGDWPGFGTR